MSRNELQKLYESQAILLGLTCLGLYQHLHLTDTYSVPILGTLYLLSIMYVIHWHTIQ